MTQQQFIADIVNTNKTDYRSAIQVLLRQNNLSNNFLDVIQLLISYNLPDSNILNITNRLIENETFDISTFENEC